MSLASGDEVNVSDEEFIDDETNLDKSGCLKLLPYNFY